MDIYDDEETERWLVWETRVLTMPDGSSHLQREMRLVWAAFDALTQDFGYTQERLIEMCVEEAQLKNMPFSEIFGPAIALFDRELCRIHGKNV